MRKCYAGSRTLARRLRCAGGPGDLSMAMGMTMTDPEVQSAIEEVLKKA